MRSYLKWVGGKRQLVESLLRLFPRDIKRYIEPFFGSGSMFFSYYSLIEDRNSDIFDFVVIPFACVNDLNPWLMNCHRMVSLHCEDVVLELENFISGRENNLELYQEIREKFQGLLGVDDIKCCVYFIYINKSCFNGIWRVNSKGRFNVPWNQKVDMGIYDERTLFGCSEMLRHYSDLYSLDFIEFMEGVGYRSGDFVFLDPPYIPISSTSNFSSYVEGGWGDRENNLLKELLIDLDRSGVKFLMTNSSSDEVYRLFGSYNIMELDAHRFVKALDHEDSRHKIKETVIRNY